MENEQLLLLKSKNPERIQSILKDFNTKNADLFHFAKLRTNDQWFSLWQALFDILRDEQLSVLHPLCLNTVRILTRDDKSLHTHTIKDDVYYLLELAELKASTDALLWEPVAADVAVTSNKADVQVEALKCLCNLVYQSPSCRHDCVQWHVTDAIMKWFATNTQYSSLQELYDMKLLFLLTAMEPEARNRMQVDLSGIDYMTEWLDEKLNEVPPQCTDKHLEMLCEMLKVLFNITTTPDKSPFASEIQNLRLSGVLRHLLLLFGGMSNERERNVVGHAVNLMTNIPTGCLTELMVKCADGEDATEGACASSAQLLIYEGHNVRCIEILLRYLHIALEEQDNSASSHDLIPPVLTVLVKCASCHPTMRHYIRSVVLPPLRDVSHRPEVGTELRNYLCRYLTLPAMMLRDLSAELLFICCKENVGRMIKYTGYGNAAGLFANRGLLDCRSVESVDYSSDSEDSDTEEYKQLQHVVNPVLGCYEPPLRNPLEGMSEEQQEYEAMQLVQLMDQLHRGGIVQPCRIGEDGKPQPVDHILQLQEELPQQQLDHRRKS